MVGAFLSACILIMYTTMGAGAGHALDLMTSISILSPHNGDTVYLDGAYQREFQGKFAHVPKGEHTITVKIADPDHKDGGTATDSVTIKVAE